MSKLYLTRLRNKIPSTVYCPYSSMSLSFSKCTILDAVFEGELSRLDFLLRRPCQLLRQPQLVRFLNSSVSVFMNASEGVESAGALKIIIYTMEGFPERLQYTIYLPELLVLISSLSTRAITIELIVIY